VQHSWPIKLCINIIKAVKGQQQNVVRIVKFSKSMVMVVLSDPFRGMVAWRNSTETQHSGHTQRSGPEIKNGRTSAKGGAPERLRCKTIQEEVSQTLQRVPNALQEELSFCFILHR